MVLSYVVYQLFFHVSFICNKYNHVYVCVYDNLSFKVAIFASCSYIMASSSREMREAIVVERSMQSAATCLVQQNYGRAFAHYLLVLKLQPEKKKEIKENFALALQEWSEQLEQQGRLEDLFMCYQQACELFPECETMLNNMGAQLFRYNVIQSH